MFICNKHESNRIIAQMHICLCGCISISAQMHICIFVFVDAFVYLHRDAYLDLEPNMVEGRQNW